MPRSAAFHGVGKLKGQEGAALLPFFFLPVISLLFYVGILLVPMCLFQLCRYMVQLCTDVYLFSLGSFSHIGDYSVFINFPMLFTSYVLII